MGTSNHRLSSSKHVCVKGQCQALWEDFLGMSHTDQKISRGAMPYILELVQRRKEKKNLTLQNGSISGKWTQLFLTASFPRLWDEPLEAGIF